MKEGDYVRIQSVLYRHNGELHQIIGGDIYY